MTKSNLKTTDVMKSKENVDEISLQELDALKAKADKADKLEADMKEATGAVSELDALKSALGGAEVADLLKAAQELKDLKKAKEEKELTDTIDVIKGFNLFAEDKVEDVAKFFVKNGDSEVSGLILTSLEKARNTIEEFGSEEHGHDLEGKTEDVSKANTDAMSNAVLDIIKSRKNK